MACKAVIIAVGIYYMEDAIYFLKKYTCSLHKACVRKINRKHKSTIVRKIGSWITWVYAPRLCVAFKKEIKDISPTEEYITGTEISDEDMCDEESVAPKSSVELQNRVEELEKELLRLQKQVSNILLKSDSKEINNFSENDENLVTSSSSTVTLPPSPPPLPPPPPPLPSTLLSSRTPLVQIVPKCANVKRDTTCTIMEELSKKPPKLRHVERSPGGRPIRTTPPSTDPADVLAAVLKKRFEAIHGEKQEYYLLSEVSTKSPMITSH